MLRHLLKYDIRWTGRRMLPLYGLTIAVAAVLRLFGVINVTGAVHTVFQTGYSVLITAIYVMTVVAIDQGFRNMLGNQGYIYLTLPVGMSTHLWSKVISGLIWVILSTVVGIITLPIIYAPSGSGDISDVISVIHLDQDFARFAAYGAGFIVLTLLVIALGIMMIYAAETIGHLVKKHRTALGVTAFLVMFIIVVMISNKLFTLILDDNSSAGIFLMVGMSITAVLFAVLFLLTNYLLKRKIDLD